MKRIALVILAVAAISCKQKEQNVEPLPAVAEEEIMYNTNEVTVLRDTVLNGVRQISVTPSNVCSSQIDIAEKDGVIQSVVFTGGCDGNTQGISRLVEGMKVEDAISRLEGIHCGRKDTSCPDQLSKALKILRKP